MSTSSPSPPANAAAPAPVKQSAHSLPVGTRLGEFEIRSVLGEGGFAIVYLAYDHLLRRTVAIKEYMPSALAMRTAQGHMQAREARQAELLQHGLSSFVEEARLLAQFDHPALIRVYRFWEENATAYMAMQLCQGQTLRALRKADPKRVSNEAWIKQVLLPPVLDALELLHASNCYHRDISPDNIMILDSGVPMLLDFGAARHVLDDVTQALTVIVKPGFAPIEQYDGVLEQGPWTDIYSLGAVLYYLVTGQALTASVSRLIKDPLPRLADKPDLGLSPAFAQTIDRALTVHPDQRIRSVAELRDALALPTFWADMQRQSVELGALRRQSRQMAPPPPPDPANQPTVALAHLPTQPLTQAPTQPLGPAPAQPPGPPAARAPAQPLRPAPQWRQSKRATKAAAVQTAGAKPPLWRQPQALLGGGAALAALIALLLWWPRPPAPETAQAPETPPVTAAAPPAAAQGSVAASAEKARVQLHVEPWGVVYVNGNMQGLTPPLKELSLPPGQHTIEIRNNADLPAHTRVLQLKPGQTLTLEHHF